MVHKPVFIPLSNKDSDMHAYAHSWSPNGGDRIKPAKRLTFGAVLFIYNMVIY